MAGKARRARGQRHQTRAPVSSTNSDPTSSAEPAEKRRCLNLPPEPPDKSSRPDANKTSNSDSTSGASDAPDFNSAPAQSTQLEPTASITSDKDPIAVASPMAPKTAADGGGAISSITRRSDQCLSAASPCASRPDSTAADGGGAIFSITRRNDQCSPAPFPCASQPDSPPEASG